MDLGPQSLSIFVTLFLILAAMGVALIVDLLKGNNEQLRELAIELKAKKDSAEKHLQVLELHTTALLRQPALMSASAGAGHSLLSERAAGGGGQSTASRPTIVPNRTSPAFAAETATATAEPGFHSAVRKSRDEGQPKREMSPAVAAVAQSVAARMAAGRMATGKMVTAAAAVSAEFEPAPLPQMRQPEIVAPVPAFAAPVSASGLTPEIIPVEIKTGIFQAPSEARKDWGRILTSRKHEANVPTFPVIDDNLLQFEPVRVAAMEESNVLPPGFHDYAVLRKAAAAGASLQGMIVSIGLNQLESSQMSEVSNFVQSLLESEDFGCQSGADEFVLVCIADGQVCQRRLSAIAEKLWDFQLRSMGQLNVQFAWGGMEARPTDKLNDVVASAIDQMTETRRARRGSTVQIAKAV